MKSQNKLIATSEMLIRKPISEVFEALVNPDITSEFWFTKSSGRLETGKQVEWEWGQFGIAATISVTDVKKDELIRFQWPSGEDDSGYRTVEIFIEPKPNDTTFVQIVEKGFAKDDQNLIREIAGQTEGWALVLAGMKAWLEHSLNLNLIADHKP